MTVAVYWKRLFSFIINAIYCCFFVFYLIRRVCIWSTMFKICSMTFILQQINIIKDKITAFNWCFLSNLIFKKKWLKALFYNFIFLLLFISSILSLLTYITNSSLLSLEDIKLISIVNWIFQIRYSLLDHLRYLLNMVYFIRIFLNW